MAYTFIKALGGEIGISKCETDKLDYAAEMVQKAKEKGVRFLLPIDNLAADHFAADAEPITVDSQHFPENLMGLDIGPKTVELYQEAIRGAGTGSSGMGPMGVFEFDAFAGGTRAIAAAIADSNAISIIGGGDSAAAIEQLGFAIK